MGILKRMSLAIFGLLIAAMATFVVSGPASAATPTTGHGTIVSDCWGDWDGCWGDWWDDCWDDCW